MKYVPPKIVMFYIFPDHEPEEVEKEIAEHIAEHTSTKGYYLDSIHPFKLEQGEDVNQARDGFYMFFKSNKIEENK